MFLLRWGRKERLYDELKPIGAITMSKRIPPIMALESTAADVRPTVAIRMLLRSESLS